MTNQRKIFGAVLVLAASAFGVDRLWLEPDSGGGAGSQSPAQAQAQPSAPAPTAPAPAHAAGASVRRSARADGREPAGAAPTAAPRVKPLAARLLEVARAEGVPTDAGDGTGDGTLAVRDAFKPSDLWYPAPAAAAPAVVQARPAVPPERLEQVRAHARLTAVMRSSRGGLALIGGQVYAAGQTIHARGQAVDGFTVESVAERSAVLRNGDAIVELKIDPPDALTSLSGLPDGR